MNRRLITRTLAACGIALLVACSGPEAKKMKFFSKGKALYDKGDYVKAKLEFKNAIQIDPKYSAAYQMIGMVALRENDLKGAYGFFSKAVELDPANRAAQYELGKIFLAVGQPDKATEKADLLLKLDPNNADALQLKGAIMVNRKEYAQARVYLEQLISRGIRTADVYFLLATSHMQGGNTAVVETVLRRGIEANPKSVFLHLALSELLARQHRVDEAAGLLLKVIDLEPAKVEHKLNLASLYWVAGREPQALEILKKLVVADPAGDDTRLKVAAFLVTRNKPLDAERELKEGIAKNGKSYKMRFALSELYFSTGRPDQGLALLKECASLGKATTPEVIQAKTALAKIYLDRNDTVQAGKYLDEVLKDNPKSTEAHFTKGNLHLLKREGANAVAEFRTVANENPSSIPVLIRLAEAHMLNKEVNLALESLKSAQKIDPASREVKFAFARYHAMQKDYRSAKDVLAGFISQNPNDVDARVLLGDILIASGELKGAAAEFGQIKKKAPQIPIGYVKSGELYLLQGQTGRAIAEYEQAVKVNPNSWRVNNDLAVLLGESSGNLDRALTLAEKARSLRPDELTIQDTLGWIYLKKGNTAKAIELLRFVQSKAPEAAIINYHLGMALYKAGKPAEAKGYLGKSLARKENFDGRNEAERTLSRI
jgi:tetratricopeptide (TPR) repeat protein